MGPNAGLGRLDKNEDLERAATGNRCVLCFLRGLRPSADLGIGSGIGWPKRGFVKVPLFAAKSQKMGVGVEYLG
jgi:hypothetical protein